MKTLEFKACGLEELTQKEIVKTNGGGFWGWLFGTMAGGLVYDLASNPKHNGAVYQDGKEKAIRMYR